MPGDPVVEEDQDEGEDRGTGRHEGHPVLAVEIPEVDDPRPLSIGSGEEVGAVDRPVGGARGVAAGVRRGEGLRDVQGFRRDVRKDDLGHHRHGEDGRDDGEVVDDVPGQLVGTVRAELEGLEPHREGDRPDAEDGGEKGGGDVGVILVGFELVVALVILLEVVVDPDRRGRRSEGVDDEDGRDQQGEDLVREPGGVLEQPVEVAHGGDHQVEGDPQADPRVEGQEGDVEGLGHGVEDAAEGQDGTRPAVDHHGLSADQSVKDPAPGRRRDHLDGPDPVPGRLGVDRSEGDGGGDAGEEQEERRRHDRLIGVRHLGFPMGADRPPDIVDYASAPAVLPGVKRRGVFFFAVGVDDVLLAAAVVLVVVIVVVVVVLGSSRDDPEGLLLFALGLFLLDRLQRLQAIRVVIVRELLLAARIASFVGFRWIHAGDG
mmetsp:Transcript_21094/g.50046  ORF Transcript_21094/g.50046 Transcript_21094/m.50046 type:complete len:431 (+) Transcript_21094:1078-2370(+)